jgi:hypothetical protein
MSEYGDGDYCAVHDSTWRKARKPHNCDACGESITPGRTYHRSAWPCDGSWSVTLRCERCEAIFAHLTSRMSRADEYCNPELNCGHEYEERWREPPPEIAALAFWLPGEPLPAAVATNGATSS